MTRTQRIIGLVIGALFIALHLPFLPPSLEDLDSINFALGVRQYDISQHQPHPPGYPLFIGAAKLLHAVGLSELHALSVLGVLAGGLGVLALMRLFALLDRERPGSPSTSLAVLVVVASPLFWFTAARPLSDMMGLAAVMGVQGLLLAAASGPAVAVAAFLAAFAAGIRSQVVWLTLPLLVLAVMRLPSRERVAGGVRALVAYGVGGFAWFIPLVLVSGGPRAYLKVFYSQGAEDLSGVAMLATTPTVRQAILAFQYHFVGPWGEWWVAALALVCAAAGLVALLLKDRRTLVTLLVAFGPYLVFDLLFQETITTRYALPLVIPIGYLAVRGVSLVPGGTAVAVALVLSGAYVSDRAMFGFSSMDVPAFRMLGDMDAAMHPEGGGTPAAPVLAMHRRDYFDLRRPFQWVGAKLPAFAERLATPPKHEWLEAVKYWNRGGRAPVWFVADPPRSDLALIHAAKRPVYYRWPFTPTILLGGSRPSEMDWHVIEAPDWYLGEGWSLTPETAGTAREDHKGPGLGGVTAWVRRREAPVSLLVGGRNLADAGPNAHVVVTWNGTTVRDEVVAPGFFLWTLPLPRPAGEADYDELRITSDNPQLAVEQFDAEPAGTPMYGYGTGWNEQEYNPTTGVLWRWSSNRATMLVRAEGHDMALTLRGEIEADSHSHVTVKAGETVAVQFDVDRTFEKTVIIRRDLLPGVENTVTIESSAFYVPAEKKWRSRDHRVLGLKLVESSLKPVS